MGRRSRRLRVQYLPAPSSPASSPLFTGRQCPQRAGPHHLIADALIVLGANEASCLRRLSSARARRKLLNEGSKPRLIGKERAAVDHTEYLAARMDLLLYIAKSAS
jgi:hypothetical protein